MPTTGQLKTNRWALVDIDSDFDTGDQGYGKGLGRSYTIADTAGCSCEQIIEQQGLGFGHTKHGCSIGAMDNWVELVNQRTWNCIERELTPPSWRGFSLHRMTAFGRRVLPTFGGQLS